MKEAKELIEFILRDRIGAADWKDDAAEMVRMAERAKWAIEQEGGA